MNDIFHRDDCRFCASKDLERVLKLSPTPLADSYIPSELVGVPQPSYPLDLYLCRNCGLSQLLDIVNPEIIYRDYIYVTTSSMGLNSHFKGYVDEVIARINPAKGSRVVDIGSNDGTLLQCFKEKGMEVLGIEPAKEIAKNAMKSGIETWPCFFNSEVARKIVNERAPANIITMNNLMANIDDLTDMIKGVRHLLAPDGVFIFESFYLADLVQNMVFDFIYHEHLSCFSVKPLEIFFRNNGMELIDVLRIPTKGGSIRYTVQLAGGPRKVSGQVTRLMHFEKDLGIQQPEVFKHFARRIENLKNDNMNFLNDLKSKGKTIAGFGASATTTTLVYHFQMADLLSFIVDDNQAKQNTFSPGCHIPILPSNAIYERKPDYVVILAWRYYEPIINKHQEFLNQGGQFIIPLPEFKLIESAKRVVSNF